MFMGIVHASSIDEMSKSLVKSQQETSKIKSQLQKIKSEKDAKIQQLEQDNASLK